MDLSRIKSVVFDFDETLYSGGDWSRYDKYVYEMFVEEKIFKDIAEAERALFEKYPDEKDVGQRALKFCTDNNLSTDLISSYNASHFYDVGLGQVSRLNAQNLVELSKFFSLYIVSNSSLQYISKSAKLLNIDEKIFKAMLTNKFETNDVSKTPCLKQILEITGQRPDEILMVGDNPVLDIEPAKKLGFQTYRVQSVKDTEDIILKLLQSKMKN